MWSWPGVVQRGAFLSVSDLFFQGSPSRGRSRQRSRPHSAAAPRAAAGGPSRPRAARARRGGQQSARAPAGRRAAAAGGGGAVRQMATDCLRGGLWCTAVTQLCHSLYGRVHLSRSQPATGSLWGGRARLRGRAAAAPHTPTSTPAVGAGTNLRTASPRCGQGRPVGGRAMRSRNPR